MKKHLVIQMEVVVDDNVDIEQIEQKILDTYYKYYKDLYSKEDGSRI